MTDNDIEKLAVKHESFGFGRVDAHGLTTHGFDPDGLRAFVVELLENKDELKAAYAEIAALRTALRFYARAQHYHVDETEEFDSVSDGPSNWLCSGVDGSATMIENGAVARFALEGVPVQWIDGDEDNTPLPMQGEVSCVKGVE